MEKNKFIEEVILELQELKDIGVTVSDRAFDAANELEEDECCTMSVSEAADMCICS